MPERGQIGCEGGKPSVEDILGGEEILRYLDEELLDLAVVDHCGVAPRALAEAPLLLPCAAHAHAAGEKARAVGDELDVLEVAGVERVASILLFFLEALRISIEKVS